MKVDVYNVENKVVGTVEAPESLFGARWNAALVSQVLTAFRANQRRPWAHAKGRGEVRGGGKKPWRQKGTGRARHGSIRSPIWIGGGKSHGPVKARSYEQKINKKMNRAAIFSALGKKFRDGEVKVIENLSPKEPKTKLVALTLAAIIGVPKTKKFDSLLIPAAEAKTLFRGARNLPKVKTLHPSALNVYDLLNYKQVLIDKDAVAFMMRHYHLS